MKTATEMTLEKPFEMSQVGDRGELGRKRKLKEAFQAEETK